MKEQGVVEQDDRSHGFRRLAHGYWWTREGDTLGLDQSAFLTRWAVNIATGIGAESLATAEPFEYPSGIRPECGAT